MIPAIVLSLGMLFFPESPRWLFDHGKCISSSLSLLVFPDLIGIVGKMKRSRSSLTCTGKVTPITLSSNWNTRRSSSKYISSARKALRAIWTF